MRLKDFYNPEKLRQLAESNFAENKKFLDKLKRRKPKNLDAVVHEIYYEIEKKTDCLKCANCCRSLGPRIEQKDIDRIPKFLNIKPKDFIINYLRMDEDGDFVFKSMPCPFLGADNYCSIYEARPKACREYPHLDQKRIHQIFTETLQNTLTCPMVYVALEELKKRL